MNEEKGSRKKGRVQMISIRKPRTGHCSIGKEELEKEEKKAESKVKKIRITIKMRSKNPVLVMWKVGPTFQLVWFYG